MEDFLKFLLVAAVVVIGIVRQSQKEAKKKAAQQPPRPQADTVPPFPTPEEEDGTYGGYIPVGPASKPEPAVRPKPVTRPEGLRTTTQPKAPGTPTPGTPNNTDADDYQLRSPDDVRRAIVWSEILKRKY
ncbi:hypothetical protein M3090_06505 [Bacteroides sp. ET71]|uniref:hypothetical protein n=1 Tax=Bacteroides sp. ET71 TaxID=2939421 RepID=UPI00201136C4|nr:hypothetical protein [Bacteroides sp. ET71]MCL1616044.1 hypothetical protein [Bacteroides sp. ET71]